MIKHLLTLLITVLTFLVTSASAQDRDKTVALLLAAQEAGHTGSLFSATPVVIVPIAVTPARDPRVLIPEVQSSSIRIKDRFVPVSGTTTSQPPPRSVPRWKVRQALRSLDLARRYAPVYGTGTGVK